MRSAELLRVRIAFGALGAVPVFLTGWLGWLQVCAGGSLQRPGGAALPLVAATADRQGWRREAVPAPRGTIVDRHGHPLAVDCECYEVRARIALPADLRSDVAAGRAWLGRLADELALALVADPDEQRRDERRVQHRLRLAGAFDQAFRGDGASAAESPRLPAAADLLIAPRVDSLAVVEALRRVVDRREFRTVSLHLLHSFQRTYPAREFTHGLVGHLMSRWAERDDGKRAIETYGAVGLESFAVLDPAPPASRRYLADGLGRRYFVAPVAEPPVATVLHTTIDLDLQRAAVRMLTEQAESEPRPKWGSLVLVEIETGDIVAAASWHRDVARPEGASFTPYQSLFEPGSIVKPLVLAYAAEVGVLDWSHNFDCGPDSAEYRQRIGGLGRRNSVRDDHLCGRLTPHGILVNSSNIGAAYIGLLLDREQWRDYMRTFGFGGSLGIGLPGEGIGGTNRRSFAADVPLRSFRANSAVSFSFGYELQATVLQIARAYLRLWQGPDAELRLCRGVEIGGAWHEVPVRIDPQRRFRSEVTARVRDALVDVVSDDPHATGRLVHARMLKEAGIDLHGLVAGKTGTAASRVGVRGGTSAQVRNASFVGLIPADQPRWLAVCVLQKDDSARFYGGSYAAPPAVRLLLQCYQLEQRRSRRQEPQRGPGGQTRSRPDSPAASGWIPARAGFQGHGR